MNLALLACALPPLALSTGCTSSPAAPPEAEQQLADHGPPPDEETSLSFARGYLASQSIDPRTVHLSVAPATRSWVRRGGEEAPIVYAWEVPVTVRGRGPSEGPRAHRLWVRDGAVLAAEGPSRRNRTVRTYYPAFQRQVDALLGIPEAPVEPADPGALEPEPLEPLVDDSLPGADVLDLRGQTVADSVARVAAGMSLFAVREELGRPMSDVAGLDGSRRLVYVFTTARGTTSMVTMIFVDGRLREAPGHRLRAGGADFAAPEELPSAAEAAIGRLHRDMPVDQVVALLGDPFQEVAAADGVRHVVYQFTEAGEAGGVGSTQYVTLVVEEGLLVDVPGYALAEQ